MTMVAGTITGLKRMKSGVVTARPVRVPRSESPASERSMTPTGKP
ncbi:hypothetical protein A2U01_0103521, partial [Trifolium medium]|nr:hypothetical protein [Trifolium medium]